MRWMLYMLYDYFAGLGLLVVCGTVVAIWFFDGSVGGFSSAWIFTPPVVYSWLMSELYRWPKEMKDS
jgi:hypothetical protein